MLSVPFLNKFTFIKLKYIMVKLGLQIRAIFFVYILITFTIKIA
ncbi:hypothetical protein T190607A01A_20101 [Tenacibaculum sp. 190524A05c]|uniref:Uncharacterized protein n=1 Tax=Tenacibaculum platacis TaxID=3137852 RepID=A0ABM9NXN9_9FLAO